MRKERGGSRNPQVRRGSRQSSQGRPSRPGGLPGATAGPADALHPPPLTPEQLIERIVEAEPPEIYLMKEMKRPVTEANVMMLLTNLADKELVHMISWAKKIPGESPRTNYINYASSSVRVTLALALASQFKRTKLKRLIIKTWSLNAKSYHQSY